MLLGQTVNSYHYRDQAIGLASEPVDAVPSSPAHSLTRSLDFADLLRAVNEIDGMSNAFAL